MNRLRASVRNAAAALLDKVPAAPQQRLSFAVGDVVAHVKPKHAYGESKVEGCPFIITSVLPDADGVEYSVNGVSWFAFHELAFVKPATEASLKYACKLNEWHEEDVEDA